MTDSQSRPDSNGHSDNVVGLSFQFLKNLFENIMTTKIETPAVETPATEAPVTQAKWSYVPPDADNTPVQKQFPFPKTPALSLIGPRHAIPEEVDPLLVKILGWVRGHDSLAEYAFCSWLRDHIKDLTGKPVTVMTDARGAFWCSVPRPDGKPSTVLFSCHVDTVDTMVIGQGSGAVKLLDYDPNFGHITLRKGSPGTCLGADDGIGVWLMLKMIEAKVPGTYIFHRGEECGGVSSKLVASKYEAWLGAFDIAVAFDRPRDNEVITHQRGGQECASNKCAVALCTALNAHNMDYAPSNRGVYTDTYEYRTIIAECFNIGVGYTDQHGANETQDYAHAVALMNAVCKVDWESLPVDRDPSKAQNYGYGTYGGYSSKIWGGGRDDWDDAWNGAKAGKKKSKSFKQTKQTKLPKPPVMQPDLLDELSGMTYDDIVCLCEDDPSAATTVIVDLMLALAQSRAAADMYKKLTGPSANM
jgi:hypothetical protein